VALQLKKAGIRNVRPLAGGFEAWRSLGFPIEPAGANFTPAGTVERNSTAQS
jgi:3-mercaptopyruvate sulfurtransferase SseA